MKKVAELIREDPGFKVNKELDGGGGLSLLHYAGSPVIPLLLAHPDIDVNVKNVIGETPFFIACLNGRTSCVREMLKDSRVKLNEPNKNGNTPLWYAADRQYLSIRWWIASGREMDLGIPGDGKTDAIGTNKWTKTEVVPLLQRFKSDPTKTRSEVRKQLGIKG